MSICMRDVCKMVVIPTSTCTCVHHKVEAIPTWVAVIPTWVVVIPTWVAVIPTWVAVIPTWVVVIPTCLHHKVHGSHTYRLKL